MKKSDFIRLLLLAAIWGASFLFFRVAAPALGPVITAELRATIGGLALLAYFRFTGVDLGFRAHWKAYLIIGTLNSALPFALFAFASISLSASYAVILNASAPLWGAVFSALWLGERLTLGKSLGLVAGVAGVALVMRFGLLDMTPKLLLASVACIFATMCYALVMRFGLPEVTPLLLASVACIFATMCYALAGIYMRKHPEKLTSQGLATGSLLGEAIVVLPLLPFAPLPVALSLPVVLSVLALALLCSTVAFVLYFKLIADVGPTKALTVTFLMPAFGMFWGALLLDEKITPVMLAGCALILLGIALIFGILRLPRLQTAK